MKIEIETAKILKVVNDIMDNPLIGIIERKSYGDGLIRSLLAYDKNRNHMIKIEIFLSVIWLIFIFL